MEVPLRFSEACEFVSINLFSDKGQRVIGRAFAEFIDMVDFDELQDLFNNSRNMSFSKKISVHLQEINFRLKLQSISYVKKIKRSLLVHIIPQSNVNDYLNADMDTSRLIRAVQSSPRCLCRH
jgi:hypothetical protein